MRKLFSTSNDLTLTIVRLVMGIVFFAHGAQKMLGWYGGYGFHGTMGFFTQMAFPLRWRSSPSALSSLADWV